MRKFGELYKEKLNESQQLHESTVVNDFKKIYSALLEHYKLTAIHDLNEKSQVSFLTELNQYWSEEKGLSDLGQNFLKKRETRLTENSTPLQKKNFLKSKANILLSETIRQTDMKYKTYAIIDEMFSQIKGENIDDVLSPAMISDIITEAFAESVEDFISNIRHELTESNKGSNHTVSPLNKKKDVEDDEEEADSHTKSPGKKKKKSSTSDKIGKKIDANTKRKREAVAESTTKVYFKKKINEGANVLNEDTLLLAKHAKQLYSIMKKKGLKVKYLKSLPNKMQKMVADTKEVGHEGADNNAYICPEGDKVWIGVFDLHHETANKVLSFIKNNTPQGFKLQQSPEITGWTGDKVGFTAALIPDTTGKGGYKTNTQQNNKNPKPEVE
jgi:hypothetical protein